MAEIRQTHRGLKPLRGGARYGELPGVRLQYSHLSYPAWRLCVFTRDYRGPAQRAGHFQMSFGFRPVLGFQT